MDVTSPRLSDETARETWWTALDDEILASLGESRPLTPTEIGARLGISESAAASCLAMLATEGHVRICLVERT